ncbi:SDR family oxidoreductase [Halalkalicoccus jeotgali]|uniref:Short-chain dehydrogenase/reductase SDR n=1 Tax=Halalkalicoccus jeotgali (strain DSM 18796 / CECT 7217 / JCM 14584 / KCTC 4019 / B3) TaxID=795797 RepID=D8J3Q5_HALJB|nr:SDR family oxidoreductase [Halalkalicoccus jeotgali]ADJ13396.1 short-chain dehydrogenase/reductase SDR [Halalkalicoccus jeotgali B3]ELY32772.1 short-chain dehydrogenase/reductase SDR [Halalkalicoccus jeotgali B3]
MDLQIDGNTALVTASSSGLGKASAKALAREGVDVVINGRDEDRLEDAREEIEAEATGAVVAKPGDLTDPEDVTALVETAVEEFGGLDHLVTSAGGPPSGPFMETEEEDWYHAYDLLVMSVVRLVKEAAPHLQEGGGTIVTITSRSVKEAIDSLVLSNSVRMSVIGLEKTLSQELAPDVRANAVLPGPHETARIQELVDQAVDRGDYDSYEEGLADWSDGIPLERIGDPLELGNTVAYLSSPKSGFINGVSVPIDGGAGASNL